MDRKTHLLIKLTEECAELIKATDKALLFGLNDRKTLDPTILNTDTTCPTNNERMEREFNDVLAAIEMLNDEGMNIILNRKWIEAKKQKVEKYIIYAGRVAKGEQSHPLKD